MSGTARRLWLDAVPRALVSAAIVAGAGLGLWQAVRCPGTAQAKVYLELVVPLKERVPSTADNDGTTIHAAEINGQRLRYTRERQPGHHGDILDTQQRQLAEVDGPSLASVLPPGLSPDDLWPGLSIEGQAPMTMARPMARFDGDGWGAIAYLDGGCEIRHGPEDAVCLARRLRAFDQTGDATTLGSPHAVVAVAEGDDVTLVFHVWADQGIAIPEPASAAGETEDDVEGDGIPAFPSCDQTTAYANASPGEAFRFLGFDCGLPCPGVLEEVDLRMRGQGWSADPRDGPAGGDDGPVILRYVGGGREVLASCSSDGFAEGSGLFLLDQAR